MRPAIEFNNVSKRYYIGTGARSLRGWLGQLPQRLIRRAPHAEDELWALRDVTFEVEPGDSLGVLGHNGAGKTTILKLLSGITDPTSGSIAVRGRLGSLIELGAGFHPEMTGRENVYLNGVMLGMALKDVRRNFDSIVDFADIERFIDTPVKRYSSGMYVRLAFAVAAHIDPSVLLVDEVLAVGDIGFRAKCYRRMAELRKSGTTIVLVSHDVYAIRDTCDRALLLCQGRLVGEGTSEEIITAYLARSRHLGAVESLDSQGSSLGANESDLARPDARKVRIDGVTFSDQWGRIVDTISSGDRLQVEIRYHAFEPVTKPIFRIDFYREGVIQTGYSTAYDDLVPAPMEGAGTAALTIDAMYVPPGVYAVSAVVAETFEYNLLDVHHQAYPLQVLREAGSRGELTLPHSWRIGSRRSPSGEQPHNE